MADLRVSVASDVIVQAGPLGITNAMLATFLTSLIIIVGALIVRRGAGVVPTRAQVAFETLFEFFHEKTVSILGSEKRVRQLFPLTFTVFLFLLVANQFTLIPFIQSIVTEDGIELFRTPTTDYSLPIALAVFMVLLANGLAFAQSPLRYVGNFINVKGFAKVRSPKDLPSALMDFFLGLMDIVGEFAKALALATRLFANIFAGEVLVAVIVSLAFVTQFIVPIPALALAIFSSFVQAFVFAILSVVYLGLSLDNVSEQTTP